MKHNCYGRDREMNLVWKCGKCGEQVPAEEFTDEDLHRVEWLINSYLENTKCILTDSVIAEYTELLEKVRRM